jgi:hypothetical protein
MITILSVNNSGSSVWYWLAAGSTQSSQVTPQVDPYLHCESRSCTRRCEGRERRVGAAVARTGARDRCWYRLLLHHR